MTESKILEYASEDTVQCSFYSASSNTDVMFWEQLCDQLNKTIDSLSVDYIWHRDEFKVYMPIENKKNDDVPAHLISTTCFGDNLEDEWFIVYLILELSKQYEDVVVQIRDNDGDFLLIEAADYLPSWANPDCTDNRVFIYKNHIHIIPPALADINIEISLKQGIEFVVQSTEQTKAPEIQQAVQKRIGYYPDKIKENIHRAIVKIPLDLAALLAMKPSLISPIVTSYCNHDEIDSKTCRNVSFENCVTVGVKFTKFLYAMLVHSKLMKNCKSMSLHKNNKKEMLGLKLTCGYEMIKSKLSEDIFSGKEYHKFIKILDESGYFRGYLEGSKSHTQLLEKAKEFFLGMECPISSSVANQISQLMDTKEFVDMKETLLDKCVPESVEEDSEEWLNIQPEQLNDLLNKRYGKQSNFKDNDIISPQAITSELSNFLKQTSDFEGIETGEKSDDDSDDNEIEFDSNEFVNSLKNMLNLISSGNDEMDIDSDFSEDYEDVSQEDTELDEELKTKLNLDENEKLPSSKTVLQNIVKSMKGEEGSTGPSSNILRNIGINKADLLDSDDDEKPLEKF